jgi:hypothetical protein
MEWDVVVLVSASREGREVVLDDSTDVLGIEQTVYVQRAQRWKALRTELVDIHQVFGDDHPSLSFLHIPYLDM